MEIMDRMLNESHYEILRRMVGRRLLSIEYEKEKPFNRVVLYVVQFNLEDYVCCLNSDIDVIDYYGAPEDIAGLFMTEGEYQYSTPVLGSNPIDKIIKSISVVNYHILSRYKPDESEYQYDITEAVILTFEDGSEIAFKRLDDFSELLVVIEGERPLEAIRLNASYDYGDDEPDWEILESREEVVDIKGVSNG